MQIVLPSIFGAALLVAGVGSYGAKKTVYSNVLSSSKPAEGLQEEAPSLSIGATLGSLPCKAGIASRAVTSVEMLTSRHRSVAAYEETLI